MLADNANSAVIYVAKDEDGTIRAFTHRPFRREPLKGSEFWASHGKELSLTPVLVSLAESMDYYDPPKEINQN